MDSQRRLEFFKEKIKETLESVKNDIPEIRYKLWIASIDACEDYDELREMAELDMQLDMFEYTKNEINPKLAKLNMDIKEIREGKSIVIKNTDGENNSPKKLSQENMDVGPVENYSTEEMLEDMDDPEIDAAMASILMARLATEPLEETYREDILDDINSEKLSLDSLDDIDETDTEELGDIGDALEIGEDDFDSDMDDIESNDETDADQDADSLFDDFSDVKTDVADSKNSDTDENSEDPFDISDNDFGNLDEEQDSDTNTEENEDNDPFSDINDEELEDELGEDESVDSDNDDPFDVSEDDFGDLEDTSEDGENTEEFDPFDISEDDFGDLEDTDDDKKNDDDDFESLNEDDFGDIDDIFSDNEKDEASFDELSNAGDIFDSNLEEELGMFEGDESSDDEDDKDPFSDIDESDFGGFDDEETSDNEDDDSEKDPFSDIDESELDGFDDSDESSDESSDEDDDPFSELDGMDDFINDDIAVEDDSDDFFNSGSKQDKTKTKEEKKPVRKIESTSIFSNGTARGNKTQDMFNSINRIGGMFSKMSAHAVSKTKNIVNNPRVRTTATSLLALSNEEDLIEGF